MRSAAAAVAAAMVVATSVSAQDGAGCVIDPEVVSDPGGWATVALSGDGRAAAFSSQADAIAPDDRDRLRNVYVRDDHDGTTVLVSRASRAHGPAANGHSGGPSISADGSRVAFWSAATNLGARPPSGRGVFVRDLAASETTLVSRKSGRRGVVADGDSAEAQISADGTMVAFTTTASNLSTADRDRRRDVYVRDLRAGATVLVSRASGRSGAAGNGDSFDPRISADGTKIAFTSTSTNLSAVDHGRRRDIYVRDIRSGNTTLVSRASGASAGPGNGPSTEPAISADGNRVAFTSGASNFSPADRNGLDDVYVRDIAAGTTELASRASGADGATGNASSFDPSLSADGAKVAFESLAGNLDPSDPGIDADIYVRDLRARATTIVSRVESGGEVEHRTARAAAIAGNGLRVAFWGVTNASGDSTRQPIWGLFQRDLDVNALTALAPGGDPPPDSDIDRVSDPIARRKLTSFGGRSFYATDVEVALSDVHGRAWLMRDGRLHRVRGASAGCGDPLVWLPARGRGSWRFRLKKTLPPGSYVLYSRAIAERGFDTTGVMETTFTPQDGNKLRFNVR